MGLRDDGKKKEWATVLCFFDFSNAATSCLEVTRGKPNYYY